MRFLVSLLVILGVFSPCQGAKQYALSMHNDVKYPKDFKHFNGVNPNAPKGGDFKLGVVGTFDSTNPFITKGNAPTGLSLLTEGLVFESLMKRVPDEPFTLYPNIAESIEVASDRSWIIFYINPKAMWADGKPVTADDVVFSVTTLRDHGRPNLRLFYSRVDTVTQLSTHSVKFTFKKREDGSNDPELPLLIGLMRVIPKHFYGKKDFEKTSLEKPLGSGPYEVETIKPGHTIIYKRRPDYWAAKLPVNVGQYNFDQVYVEYYREPNVARMAFASGAYDFRAEINPQEWAKGYDFKAVKDGRVKKVVFEHTRPVGLHALAMNLRRPLFQDQRVRQALACAFDFPWINKNLYTGIMKRNRSLFDNTELAHQGAPSPEELELLKPYQDKLPPKILKQPYYSANSQDEESFRQNMQHAAKLLKEAGWVIQNGRLINEKTKEPFEFLLLLHNKEDEKVALAFARNLKHLGIKMNIRTLDPAQFEMRRLKFDYDMIVQTWGTTLSPGTEQTYYWSSKAADEEGSRNYLGVKNPALDFLCQKLATATTRSELLTAAHALDRVLMGGDYMIPLYYSNKQMMAYWDKVDHPAFEPDMPIHLTTWWTKEKR